MELVILLAIVLVGSIVESMFAFLLGGTTPKDAESAFDVKTDTRYDRLGDDLETGAA